MLTQPRKEKYRKQFRGRRKGKALRGNEIVFGEYGLKATSSGWVSGKQLEAARKKITFMTQRTGKYWVRVFPAKPVTSKPVGVKMGSGKGAIEQHVAVVRPGVIMFELAGVSEEIARDAFRKAGHKLSVDTRFVEK